MLDDWFVGVVQPRLKGRSGMVRFADDAVLHFETLAWVIDEGRSETKQKASVARRAALFRLKAYRHTSMSKNASQRGK